MLGPEPRALRDRLALPIAALVATHVVGVLGYHWLWRAQGGTWMDALFMTFTTIATIGYGEVRPLDTAGRLLTMGIAVCGIGSLFYTFSVGLDHLTSDVGRQARRLKRMQRRIDQLEGHFVLAGFGRVGREAAHELRQARAEVVVIDPAEHLAGAVSATDFPVIRGDATDDATLLAAGLHRAKGLVVTTASDATNLYVILSARLLKPDLFIVSRAVDDASVPKLLRAGANRVISPYAIGGRRLAHLMLSPRLVDFFETAFHRGRHALRIADVLVGQGTGAVGRTVAWLQQAEPAGATVLAVVRGDQVLPAPGAALSLGGGDHLLVLGTDAQLEAVEALLAA
ncbi:MAG TPA: NAD-binding protein [Myxococcaceae bacterium]|nr:NAD-binding protein [Myxococcaceae bacterium]